MANVQTRDCDVCKVLRANRYRIVLYDIDEAGQEAAVTKRQKWTGDLCTKHYDQLKAKISRAITLSVKLKAKKGGGN